MCENTFLLIYWILINALNGNLNRKFWLGLEAGGDLRRHLTKSDAASGALPVAKQRAVSVQVHARVLSGGKVVGIRLVPQTGVHLRAVRPPKLSGGTSDVRRGHPKATICIAFYLESKKVIEKKLTIDFHFGKNQLHFALAFEFGQIHRELLTKCPGLIPRHLENKFE